ncbi:MAG: flippase [Hydrococcus sp. C42_A2020_068]|nr:flippase [Hydrococcus sp. C42_A2020_068]
MFKKLAQVNQKLSPELRKVIGNIGWLSVEKIFTIVMSLFVGIYTIRYLGTESFGKLSYGVSFVSLFEAIAKLGLDGIVIRNLVQKEESTQEILGTAFVLKLIGSLVTIVLVGCAAFTFNHDSQLRWIILIIAVGLLFSSFDAIDYWFQSKVKSGAIAITRSFQLILSSLARILFIVLGLPLIAFVWLILADVILKAIGMIWIYTKSDRSILRWKFNGSKAIEMLKDSWPLIFSGLTIALYMKIDQVMLGNMTSNEEVGNYAAAVRLSEVWYFIPMVICSSVFPAILRAKIRSKHEYYSKLQQLYDLMAWISLLVAIPMTFGSEILMTALLGEPYKRAGEILALHIWAGLFVFLGVAVSQWWMAENLTKFSAISTSLGAGTNIVLNFLLIPSYGGVGAAIATIISYAIASHVLCLICPFTFKTGWMLTKALFVPLRISKNLTYLSQLKKYIV